MKRKMGFAVICPKCKKKKVIYNSGQKFFSCCHTRFVIAEHLEPIKSGQPSSQEEKTPAFSTESDKEKAIKIEKEAIKTYEETGNPAQAESEKKDLKEVEEAPVLEIKKAKKQPVKEWKYQHAGHYFDELKEKDGKFFCPICDVELEVKK